MSHRFSAARQIVLGGVGSAFPAAVVAIGRHDRVLWEEAFGTLSDDPESPPATMETVFDLASLTKVLATTSLAMIAVDQGRVKLTARVNEYVSDWRGQDRETVTIEDLLSHTSGLTAHLPFYRDHSGRTEFERAIATLPLEYAPRTRSVYSDLGFILLGFMLEDLLGESLDTAFVRLATERGWDDIAYRPRAHMRRRSAPTEVDRWRGRHLVGEVHDENAWALGGVAGHAGLFGTARSVGCIAREILAGLRGHAGFVSADTVARFATRSQVPRSTRALGWDTMQPTSSCGTRMSSRAIGHTGFTGTSLWVDPERDVYIVLLTNRVCPTRTNDALLQVRPAFHDALMGALEAPPQTAESSWLPSTDR